MQFIKSRILKSLATAGKAFVAEDVDGLRDGADNKQLETHIQRKLGNTEVFRADSKRSDNRI